MIRLQVVRWKNFLSTGNQFLEAKLDKETMTLVVGKNGAGKSTMIDAITFSLFGKPFKKISKNQLVNTINQGDTITEIEFLVGQTAWKIRRGIKPVLFEIYNNGKLVNQDAKAMDYQKYLEDKVLKLNFKSFTQIVVLGSASFVPFMQLSANDRRIIIEDILDIGIFSIMRNLLKDRVSMLKEELNEVEYEIKLLQEKIKLHETQSVKKKKSDEAKIVETEKEINRLHAEIEVHEEVLFSLTKSISDEDSINTKNTELDKYHSQIKKNLKRLGKEKKFFQEKENCPTCEQDIDETFKKNKLNSLQDDIEEMDDGLDKLESEIEKVFDRLMEIKECNSQIQDINSEITSKNTYIKSHQRFIKDIKEESEEIDVGKSNILNRELEEQKGLRTQYSEQKRYYDILGEILNDKGIKTKIIRKYLPVINNYVNLYLKDMDFFVNFQLDENFQETIKSRHRDDFSYYSFSEGEKKRIDIALLLTWRHIASMRNSVNVNLLILDEVFDASLDQAGVDDLMKLFGILEKTNLFIISHKLDILDDKFPAKITVEKLKNFTTMEYR